MSDSWEVADMGAQVSRTGADAEREKTVAPAPNEAGHSSATLAAAAPCGERESSQLHAVGTRAEESYAQQFALPVGEHKPLMRSLNQPPPAEPTPQPVTPRLLDAPSSFVEPRPFVARHIGPDDAELEQMLQTVGVSSLKALVEAVVPPVIRRAQPMRLPAPLDEAGALARLANYAAENQCLTPLIGMGYHGTVTPPVIQRNVLENPAWYTAYTPYQPEISQGRLEALLNFQTVITELSGMEVANASLLDEATAAAEAMAMTLRIAKRREGCFLIDPELHPQTFAVLHTRAEPLGLRLVRGTAQAAAELPEGCLGVILQYPGSGGAVPDLRPAIAAAHAAGALAIVAADPLALALLTPPGELGADIVLGSTQRFGVPLGCGGPHAAYFATRERFRRQLPGRLVSVSIDSHGRPAYRLALQTREQHIRRERATSNICTAQVLLAVMAGSYVVWHGAEGLRAIARRTHGAAAAFAVAAQASGYRLRHEAFFDTVVLEVGAAQAQRLATAARQAGFNLRLLDGGVALGFNFDETSDDAILRRLATALGLGSVEAIAQTALRLPEGLRRRSSFLRQELFRRYRSETEMMRYLRRLADKDLALDRTMIPLGSCTMKLNASAEMMPISWPGFSALHPYAPADQLRGYARLVAELENWLAEATGYAAVSLQPNAGSQGEFAGLLAIRNWHRARGEEQRDICLIPASAHGTNPASAAMAGMRVLTVACDTSGNIDVADLRVKARKHSGQLAALMVTYPSTHGVFEEAIGELCEVVHEHGGQVYMDGANLNALVGLASLPDFGADVSHLNLHKTFCIPHGGGGPGVGPVAVAAHLVDYLPGDPLSGEKTAVGAVSAARWGNAGILPIAWAYIAMMGAGGLLKASQVAILSANYIAQRLAAHYCVLYTGRDGWVAHECVIDLRSLRKQSGLSNEDVAKRLIDYGFHAPTMSFPVPGTLMIEPTESEGLVEIDRFCDAMIAIRGEIARVEAGEWPHDDNPLVNAPHTAQSVMGELWEHPYTRAEAAAWAAVPGGSEVAGGAVKYWSPVGRVDSAWGDRNLRLLDGDKR